MKNILITGGAGFIGSRLCEKLFDQGNNITVLDNLLRPFFLILIVSGMYSFFNKFTK